MLRFRSENFAGSSVQYSPFLDSRMLVGASANYGLVGNGRLYMVDILGDGQMVAARQFDTQDSVYSACWSELNQNQAVVANGDGSLRLFDATTPQSLAVMAYKEHTREVFDVEWGLVNKSTFISSSWDGTVRIWDPTRPQSLAQMGSPNNIAVYQAKPHPRNDSQILTAHADSTAKILDARTGAVQVQARALLQGDCMTVDWNKYDPNLFASGGVDKVVKVWDIRNLQSPVQDFGGHEYAVKSLKWSPHSPTMLMSASYDMTVKVWDTAAPRVPMGCGTKGLVKDFFGHTEFAVDCDWSLWGEPGWVASIGWDQMVYVWKI